MSLAVEYEEDVPPAGTACAGCRRLGHYCMAKRYCGESSALCMACATGEDCSVVTARRKTEEQLLERFDMPAGECRSLPLPADPARRVMVDVPQVRRNTHGLRIALPAPRFLPRTKSKFKPELLDDDELDVVKAAEVEVDEVSEVEAPVEIPPAEKEEEMPTGVPVKFTDEEKKLIAESTLGPTELAKKLGKLVKAVAYQQKKLRAGKPRGKPGPKPKAAVPPKPVSTARPPFSVSPSNVQLVEIGGNARGSADSLLNALDKHDAAKAAAQSLAIELTFSVPEIRRLLVSMTDEAVMALAKGGLQGLLKQAMGH